MSSLKGNSLLMKEVNANIILKALKSEKRATTQKLSEITGLSTVTVGSILQQLLKKNEVYKDDLIPSNGGRPAYSYCFNAEYSHGLIIYTHEDNGNDMAYVRVVNLFGECVCKDNFILKNITLDSFEPVIDKLIKEYPSIKAIGFGLPGTEYNGIMKVNDYPGLNGTPFSDHYRSRYGLPVEFKNDVNAAVIGYCHLHKREITSDAAVVYIYFPRKYCPGVGIYINGRVYTGLRNFAGEIQNMPIGVDWETLDYSCFDAVCNSTSKLIISILYLFDPEKIILYGSFLNPDYMKNILMILREKVTDTILPEINMSEDFNYDFERGVIKYTLDKLEKTLSLIE